MRDGDESVSGSLKLILSLRVSRDRRGSVSGSVSSGCQGEARGSWHRIMITEEVFSLSGNKLNGIPKER